MRGKAIAMALVALFLATLAHLAHANENLPVNGNQGLKLIDHALHLKSVQETIAIAKQRGYVRRPEADGVIEVMDESAVFLGFERPGLVLPDGQSGEVLIIVNTEHDKKTGKDRTVTGGTIIVMDSKNKEFLCSDQTLYDETEPVFVPPSSDITQQQFNEKAMAFAAC